MPKYQEIYDAVFYSHVNPKALADILSKVKDLRSLEGSVTISGTLKFGSQLTAVVTGITNNSGDLSYVWKRGSTVITGATSATYTLVAADIGQLITVVVSSDVEQDSLSAVTTVIFKADGPAAPTLTGGITVITGLSAAVVYEYKAAADTDYTPVAASSTSITGLAAGVYNVRVAETATALRGTPANVTVTAE